MRKQLSIVPLPGDNKSVQPLVKPAKAASSFVCCLFFNKFFLEKKKICPKSLKMFTHSHFESYSLFILDAIFTIRHSRNDFGISVPGLTFNIMRSLGLSLICQHTGCKMPNIYLSAQHAISQLGWDRLNVNNH